MSEKPAQVRELEREFWTFFPSDSTRGLASTDMVAIQAAYVDERLSWEVENRGYIRILTLLSFLTLVVLIGFAIMFFVHKWERDHMDKVHKKTAARISALRKAN
jgi:hypothetical protein